MSEKQKESIRFVTRHYSAGAFKAGRGRWHEYIPAEPWWRRRGIAAAAGCVVLAAAASAGLYFGLSPSKQVPETTSPPRWCNSRTLYAAARRGASRSRSVTPP